jgi:hypothetical protein
MHCLTRSPFPCRQAEHDAHSVAPSIIYENRVRTHKISGHSRDPRLKFPKKNQNGAKPPSWAVSPVPPRIALPFTPASPPYFSDAHVTGI